MESENKIVDINDHTPNIKHSNPINEFFWICSGVNRKILRQCPTEYSKYFGIGGTIFFTAAMAALSGGYAFYTIFNDEKLAMFFGLFWGLLILNLDRFIVNTMYSDGKHTISWNEFVAGVPRLIIALFLGIVISTPLEMKIFEDRINSQIVKDNLIRTETTRSIADPIIEELKNLEDKQQQLFKDRKELEDNLYIAEKNLADEEAGIASGKVGRGPIWNAKKGERDACKAQLSRWENNHKTQLAQLEKDISTQKSKLEKIDSDIEDGLEDDGFCIRYEAFSNVKAENSSVRLVSLFIMLLFIIIEIAPTFFKMMIASGPYDELLREEIERKKTISITNVSCINSEANTSIQIEVAKNEARLKAEILANERLLEKIASAQADLLETAIEEWRKQELEKIKQNPSQYIKGNTNS